MNRRYKVITLLLLAVLGVTSVYALTFRFSQTVPAEGTVLTSTYEFTVKKDGQPVTSILFPSVEQNLPSPSGTYELLWAGTPSGNVVIGFDVSPEHSITGEIDSTGSLDWVPWNPEGTEVNLIDSKVPVRWTWDTTEEDVATHIFDITITAYEGTPP